MASHYFLLTVLLALSTALAMKLAEVKNEQAVEMKALQLRSGKFQPNI